MDSRGALLLVATGGGLGVETLVFIISKVLILLRHTSHLRGFKFQSSLCASIKSEWGDPREFLLCGRNSRGSNENTL